MNVADTLSRKANAEDMAYYRREIGFKVDKSELEAFRQEYVERVTGLEIKMNEKSQGVREVKEAMEARVEAAMKDIKVKVQ